MGATCLEPGRELDALVCEKVFDWRWVTLPVIQSPIGSVTGEIECLLPPDVPDSGPCRAAHHVERGAVHEGYFSWSTDWMAIPVIMKQMPRYTFQFERHHRGSCFCRIILPGECMVDRPTQQWEASSGFSLPHAVCAATLQAIEDK